MADSRIDKFRAENNGRTPSAEELKNFIKANKLQTEDEVISDIADNWKDNASDILNYKGAYGDLASSSGNNKDNVRMDKPFFETPADAGVPDLNKPINEIENIKTLAYTPQLNLNPKERLASSYNNALPGDFSGTSNSGTSLGEAVSDSTTQQNQPKSQTSHAKNLGVSSQSFKEPTVSPETQQTLGAELKAPTDFSKDTEMEAAQAQARENQARELYAMAGRQIAQGLGGLGSGTNVELSKDLETQLGKTANQPVENLTTAREALGKKLALASEVDKRTPTSAVSRAAQLLAVRMAKSLNMDKSEIEKYKTMSSNDLEGVMNNMRHLAESADKAAQRKNEAEANRLKAAEIRQGKLAEQERNHIAKVGTYKGEPDVSKLKQRLEQVSSVIANIGDVNSPWTEIEKQAIQQEINAFLKGGMPTDQDARHTYKSMLGEGSKLLAELDSNPKAFNDPKTKQRILNFVKPVYEHHKQYLDRRDARKLISEGYNTWTDAGKAEAEYMYPDAVELIKSKKIISPYGAGHSVANASNTVSDKVQVQAVSGPHAGQTRLLTREQAKALMSSQDAKDYKVVE